MNIFATFSSKFLAFINIYCIQNNYLSEEIRLTIYKKLLNQNNEFKKSMIFSVIKMKNCGY